MILKYDSVADSIEATINETEWQNTENNTHMSRVW